MNNNSVAEEGDEVVFSFWEKFIFVNLTRLYNIDFEGLKIHNTIKLSSNSFN